MDKPLYTANDIKYRNVIPLITGEYVSSKNDDGSLHEPLCYKPRFVSHHLIHFTDENPFRSHKKCVRRSRYYCGKYLSFVKRVQNSTLIVSFHLIQPER